MYAFGRNYDYVTSLLDDFTEWSRMNNLRGEMVKVNGTKDTKTFGRIAGPTTQHELFKKTKQSQQE